MMNRLIFISMKILIGLSDNCILTMTAPYAQEFLIWKTRKPEDPYFRASGGDGSYPLFIGTNNEYAQKAGNDAEIIWNSSWSQFRARIESYNSSTGRVTFKAPDNSFA